MFPETTTYIVWALGTTVFMALLICLAFWTTGRALDMALKHVNIWWLFIQFYSERKKFRAYLDEKKIRVWPNDR